MSVELAIRIRAIDEATESIRKVGEEVKKTAEAVENGNKSISRSTEEASEAQRRLSKAAAETDASFRDLVKGFSGATTAALALYQGYDRLQQMQYSISRANYQVEVATAALEEAQRRYNAAVERYGPASEQAASAARDLQLAQERYSLAVERAEILQGNYSQAVMSFALSVVPTTITAVDSLIKVKQNLSAASDLASGAVKAFGAALSFLAANPIVLVAAAIAALILALKYLYDTNESFRNAVNALASALSNTLKPAIDLITNALTYLWNNVIKPVADAFGWLVGVIAGAFQRLRGESEEAKVDVNQDFIEIRNQAVESGAQVRTSVQSAGSAVQGFASTVRASEGVATSAFQGISSSAQQMAEEVYKGYTKVAEGVWVATDALKRAAIESAKAIGQVWDEYEARLEKATKQAAAPKPSAPGTPAFQATAPAAPAVPFKLEPVQTLPGGLVVQRLVEGQYGFEGLVRRPTLFLAGEAGAEYVSIRPGGQGAVGPISITVNVAGSADERVIGQAVREIERALRSVVFEKTSSGAPEWSRRIRLGGGI
jgi:phage-related protein